MAKAELFNLRLVTHEELRFLLLRGQLFNSLQIPARVDQKLPRTNPSIQLLNILLLQPASRNKTPRLQVNTEICPLAKLTFDFHFSAHLLDHVLANAKSQSNSVRIVLTVLREFAEVEEKTILCFLRHTVPEVSHCQLESDPHLLLVGGLLQYHVAVCGLPEAKGILYSVVLTRARAFTGEL